MSAWMGTLMGTWMGASMNARMGVGLLTTVYS
jgi:hypothetical protein